MPTPCNECHFLSLSAPTDASNTSSTDTLAEAHPFLSNVARGLPDGFNLSLGSSVDNAYPPAVNYTLATSEGVQTVRLDNSGVDKVGFTPVGASYDASQIYTLSMVFRCASCAPMAFKRVLAAQHLPLTDFFLACRPVPEAATCASESRLIGAGANDVFGRMYLVS